MRRPPWSVVVVLLAWLGVAACEGRYRCNRQEDGTLDCSELCRRYCRKARECGLDGGPHCQTDCEKRTEAGGETSNFSCVIENACEDAANCSI